MCKIAIQILKEHQKTVLGVVSDSPRTQQALRSHLSNPILGIEKVVKIKHFC